MLLRRSNHRKMILHRWSKPSFWFWCWYWWCCSILVVTEASKSSFPLSSSSSPSSYSFRRSLRERSVSTSLTNEHVCSNIDIRNSVDHFYKLNNCTVVEGFVQILLIDNATPQDFENRTFPKLREITDYLLLYRVEGLTTMAKLFPNLAVIKGRTLFHNYALVIFEMRSMHEVGLVSLTAIARGSVRIEKNPHLCYVDTIDWDLIARAGRGGHFIKDNKPFEQCPNACPANKDCPQGTLPDIGKQVRLCWNSQACQKICSPLCEQQNLTCSESHCCDQECIGGCFGLGKNECIACRHVSFNGKCLKKCPSNTFQYLGRRCVYDFECRNTKHKLSILPSSRIYWKPFNRECLTHCPAGYTEHEIDKHLCKPCKNRCPKVCDSAVVESVASAQKLRGCTYIDGSLEIQIQGGDNVIKELETSLSSIQEIRGYLKIARSFPLVSLNFLKDLTHIRGERLDKKEYAFLVLENHNLQELWDWENRETKLQIGGGKIFFHFNSKLCPNKIRELKKFADVMDWDERDVSPSSNGDRVACNVINIEISVWKTQCEIAGLSWKNFRKHYKDFDFRSLLGYVVHYREAPSRNVTKFDGRDACGSDVWKVDDVEVQSDDDDSDEIITIITQLKPYTTYAAYMRTYTIASAPTGAESEIIYFTTKPDTPSPPTNVRAYSTGHNEIVIAWSAPKKPNGNVTHYVIDGLREKEFSEFISQRNYCIEPLVLPQKKTFDDRKQENDIIQFSNDTSTSENEDSKECCTCEKNTRLKKQENDAESQIHFEDFLHNNIYIKNPNHDRRKQNKVIPILHKSSTKLFNTSSTEASVYFNKATAGHRNIVKTTTEPSRYNITDIPVQNNENRFHHVIYKHMFHVVNNLHHFTEYTIEIRACQEVHSEPCNNASPCSTQAITIVRTLPLASADDIDNSSVVLNTDNATSGSVFVKWDEPKDPNGLIVSYHIELKLADARDHKHMPVCITQSEYSQKMGYNFYDLSSGNYSLRLRATSLSGHGNWTRPKYFVIPEVKDGISNEVLAVLTVFTILAIPAIIGTSIFFFRRKYAQRSPDGILYASVNPEYISAGLVYEPDEWEILREKIAIGQELGQGSFGMVYKGEIKGFGDFPDPLPCAIKTVNDSATMRERIEFLQEASVMKAFNCHHIVKLLGVVSKGHPTLVIMELMSKGDLKAYLRAHRPDNEDPNIHPPTYKDILQMAAEIADGMAYLSAKKFVHRDLAARNCMVAHDYTVKIGDFGMTRDIYETDYYRKGGKGLLPVRWMAPECLKDGVFSCQSDIWSYGVVLWEMATFASQPYQGLANEQVLNYVISGRIMEKPENCPEKLYTLMKLCWVYTPKCRLTFTEVIDMLLPDINEPKFRPVSYYLTHKLETSPKETETGDNESTSTPLRIRYMEGGERPEESEEESDVQYFPPTRNILDDNYISNNPSEGCSQNNFDLTSPTNQSVGRDSATGNDGSKGHSIHSNEGSKGMSSSDGSKGSKVSNISNGSIANGHVSFSIGRTTTC